MIKITNIETFGWESAIRGMRNPMNSWDKSDSIICKYPNCFGCKYYQSDCNGCEIGDENLSKTNFYIGKNDLDLMKRLCNAGTDHRKFMRMINVTMDITAPLYWIAEHDTYKVGTVRNSCSFMHKGVSKPFEINDFSVQDERIYYLLNPIKKEHYDIIYPYDTKEYRIYELKNGRKYKIYKNGKIVSCKFEYIDNYGTGRKRHFEEREIKPSETKCGYYEVNLGGRNGEKWLVHRLVATVWKENKNNYSTVNHINGNKGDNSYENLEWCSLKDNIKDGFNKGLYEKNKLHSSYTAWKNGHIVVTPEIKMNILQDFKNGYSLKQISNKYKITEKQANNLISIKPCENYELFISAYYWEMIINELNLLRDEYLETKDDNIFKEIRQILPQGYNCKYTWSGNYEVLANMYKSRKNHKLDEWREFCKVIETLPYSELITNNFKN